MFFREIIVFIVRITKTLSKNAEILHVVTGGKYSYHCVLKG
jgi:hypothetical protein